MSPFRFTGVGMSLLLPRLDHFPLWFPLRQTRLPTTSRKTSPRSPSLYSSYLR